MARQKKYRAGLAERLGRVPERLRPKNAGEECIWIHAVSVGEALAIGGLITRLRDEFPSARIVISTTTATGQQLARERYGEESVFFFPIDLGFAIKPYLTVLRPKLIVLAETEFWPNFLRLAKQSGAKTAVVNARVSDRSLPGYKRWQWLFRRALKDIDLFLAQSAEDQSRLSAIGAPPERVQITGNLKFDVQAPPRLPIVDQLRSAFQQSGAQFILVCGSTVDREEEILLDAFRQVLNHYPDSMMVLAPRKPERFDAVAGLLTRSGIRFWRRSQFDFRETPTVHRKKFVAGESPALQMRPLTGGVFLLDSLGELAAIYSLATIAFVGGSLVPAGGHNILEPAQFGAPIIVGPYTHNFRDVIEIFRRNDAVRIAEHSGKQNNPGQIFVELLQNPMGRMALGQRGLEVFREQSGATARTVQALASLLGHSRPPTLAQSTEKSLG